MTITYEYENITDYTKHLLFRRAYTHVLHVDHVEVTTRVTSWRHFRLRTTTLLLGSVIYWNRVHGLFINKKKQIWTYGFVITTNIQNVIENETTIS